MMYYFDVTTTANHVGRLTGIARTEVSLAKNLATVLGDQLRFVVYSNVRGRFYELPGGAVDHRRCNGFLLALDQIEDFEARPAEEGIGNQQPSTVIVCGSAWMQNERYTDRLLDFCASQRARLHFMVHDVIPYFFPYWFEEGYTPKFVRSLGKILSRANGVSCNSVNTRRDVETLCGELGLETPPLYVFRLGDELDPALSNRLEQELDYEDLLKGRPFVLATGAINRRKNYDLLFWVWRRLLMEDPGTPDLVIVGGWTSEGKQTARMFLEDPVVSRHSHILAHVTDRQLVEFYERALFTVYPSLYEGWGLPVCESFQHGKMCLASNSSSIAEILPGYSELISPHDVELWASRVSYFGRSRLAREAVEEEVQRTYEPQSWLQSAREFCRGLEEAATTATSRGSANFRDCVRLDEVDAAELLSGEWGGAERWGRWLRGTKGELRLSQPLSGRGKQDRLLIVTMRAVRRKTVKLLVNDEVRCLCDVDTHLRSYVVSLSKSDFEQGELRLAWESHRIERPAHEPRYRDFNVGVASVRFSSRSALEMARVVARSEKPRATHCPGRRAYLSPKTVQRGVGPRPENSVRLYPLASGQVEFNVWVGGSRFESCSVVAIVNGALAGSFQAMSQRSNRVCIPLSAAELEDRGVARVEFHAFTEGRRPKRLPAAVLESRPIAGVFGSLELGDAEAPPILRAGDTVKFGATDSGSALDYLGFGWSDLEPYGVNSAGPAADLEFLLDEELEELKFVWSLKCRNEEGAPRSVAVDLNGGRLAELEVAADRLMTSVVRCRAPGDRMARLRFELLGASPLERFTLRYVGARS